MVTFSDFVEQIKQLPIVPFIGRWVKLRRQGQNFVGLCPFHQEKTPSFSVNEQKGFFYCFGCGASGSIVDFAMKHENLSFIEATQRLAEMHNIPVPNEQHTSTNPIQKKIFEILEEATHFCQSLLSKPSGRSAMAYLEKRGLHAQTITQFRLGWLDNSSQSLLKHLTQSGYSQEIIHEAGLTSYSERTQTYYDRFRGRIMFPIISRQDKVIGFGGRLLETENTTNQNLGPKYLNSPETTVFHKGDVLYGEFLMAKTARIKKRLIVVEGYMDVIGLHQAGFNEAVAPLGTAINTQQIERLWHYVDEPIICFDGDQAGIRAAQRLADLVIPILKPGKSIQIATMPSGYDPDLLVLTQGANALEHVLQKSQNLADFIWQQEVTATKIDTPERWAGFKERILKKISDIPNNDVKSAYYNFYQTKISKIQQQGNLSNPSPLARKKNYSINPNNRTYGTYGAQEGEAIRKSTLNHGGFEYFRLLRVVGLLIIKPTLIAKYAEELSSIETMHPIGQMLRDLIGFLLENTNANSEQLHRFLLNKGHNNFVDEINKHRLMLLPADADHQPDEFFEKQLHEALEMAHLTKLSEKK